MQTERLPVPRLDRPTHKLLKIRSDEMGITITEGIRVFVRAWVRRDECALKILDEARVKK